jgi:hypothetical protein
MIPSNAEKTPMIWYNFNLSLKNRYPAKTTTKQFKLTIGKTMLAIPASKA